MISSILYSKRFHQFRSRLALGYWMFSDLVSIDLISHLIRFRVQMKLGRGRNKLSCRCDIHIHFAIGRCEHWTNAVRGDDDLIRPISIEFDPKLKSMAGSLSFDVFDGLVMISLLEARSGQISLTEFELHFRVMDTSCVMAMG